MFNENGTEEAVGVDFKGLSAILESESGWIDRRRSSRSNE
jgi:hypothetical protein